ncbi:MAG: type II toxin-antitoxin system VapC family toxin [Nitrospirae bacterium]|nr:type II toxin-antitoxin system VapC family toxin [Nitrospirota bacterium]
METSNIIVDTDIIIDYLKKRQPGAEFLKKAYLKYRINVTSVTIIPLDETAARKAAAIHFALRSKGIDIGVKDSFIAGICEAYNMPLLTRNINHFNRIPGLKLLAIE